MAKALPERERLLNVARALWFQGVQAPRIAEEMRLNESTIRSWIRRERWQAPAAEAKDIVRKVGAETPLLSHAHDLAEESLHVRHKLSAVVSSQADAVKNLVPGKDPAKVHRRAQALRETVNAASVVYGWNTQDQLAAWATISKRQPEVKRVSQDGTVESVPEEVPA